MNASFKIPPSIRNAPTYVPFKGQDYKSHKRWFLKKIFAPENILKQPDSVLTKTIEWLRQGSVPDTPAAVRGIASWNLITTVPRGFTCKTLAALDTNSCDIEGNYQAEVAPRNIGIQEDCSCILTTYMLLHSTFQSYRCISPCYPPLPVVSPPIIDPFQ